MHGVLSVRHQHALLDRHGPEVVAPHRQTEVEPELGQVGAAIAGVRTRDLILVAGMTVGFVAGQVAPDIFGTLFGTSASVVTDAPALTQNADYGIRHIAVTAPLSQADDYGVRHLSVTTLTEADDYATRHMVTTPLTPADDYGVRHADQP